MGFLQKLFDNLSAKPQKRYHVFTVKCRKCGETIEGRVDLDNDLSVDYDESGGDTFYARKVLMGSNRCFQQIEANFKFDSKRKLLEQEVSGGEFVS